MAKEKARQPIVLWLTDVHGWALENKAMTMARWMPGYKHVVCNFWETKPCEARAWMRAADIIVVPFGGMGLLREVGVTHKAIVHMIGVRDAKTKNPTVFGELPELELGRGMGTPNAPVDHSTWLGGHETSKGREVATGERGSNGGLGADAKYGQHPVD